jgi:hypothetical protein
MSEFSQRKAAAFELLKGKGIKSSNYAPPLLRLLWKMGVEVRPPHFGNYWWTATWMGVFFGLGWGGVMWFISWEAKGIPMAGVAAMVVTAGAAFGIAMATYYAHERKKHALPAWDDLDSEKARQR